MMNDEWVSASALKNYMLNDHLCDWLDLYFDKVRLKKRKRRIRKKRKRIKFAQVENSSSNIESFKKFITTRGHEFEKNILDRIKTKLKKYSKTPVVTISDIWQERNLSKTLKYMLEGIPVIASAPLKNSNDKTYGTADIIIRNDYLNLLVPGTIPGVSSDKLKINTDFHYVIIDVKFSTIPLTADSVHILNQDRYPAYKAQLYVYTKAMGLLQNYVPDKAYILGRGWRYKKNGKLYKDNDPFTKLGVVDYSKNDSWVINKSKCAAKWVRDVRTNGHEWDVLPSPTHRFLYPNMCIDSSEWNAAKKKIAKSCEEITLIWQCGIKNRELALDKNITKFTDKKCTAKLLGFKRKRAEIVDSIIHVNSNRCEELVLPKKLNKRIKSVVTQAVDKSDTWPMRNFYIDFETISDVFLGKERGNSFTKSKDFLYMIGVFSRQDGYRCFLSKDLTEQGEYDNAVLFSKYISNCGKAGSLWHYSSAELTIWNRLKNYYIKNPLPHTNPKKDLNIYEDQCSDLLELIKDTPIVVKNAFNFSLKSIANALHGHGLIKHFWEAGCDNGLDSMVYAWLAYKKKLQKDNTHLNDLIKYNYVDCIVMYEILKYLKNNH